MIYLLVGHRARLPIVVRKEALLYYQIVAADPYSANQNGERGREFGYCDSDAAGLLNSML
jgi:hypothetical protein